MRYQAISKHIEPGWGRRDSKALHTKIYAIRRCSLVFNTRINFLILCACVRVFQCANVRVCVWRVFFCCFACFAFQHKYRSTQDLIWFDSVCLFAFTIDLSCFYTVFTKNTRAQKKCCDVIDERLKFDSSQRKFQIFDIRWLVLLVLLLAATAADLLLLLLYLCVVAVCVCVIKGNQNVLSNRTMLLIRTK